MSRPSHLRLVGSEDAEPAERVENVNTIKPFKTPAELPTLDVTAPLESIAGVAAGPVLWVPKPYPYELDAAATAASGCGIPSAYDCPSTRSNLLADTLPGYQDTFAGRKIQAGAGWDHPMQRAVIGRIASRPAVEWIGSHPLVEWTRKKSIAVGYIPHYSLAIVGGRRVLLDVFPPESAVLDSMATRVNVLTRLCGELGWQYCQLNGHRSDRLYDAGGGWLW